MGLILAIGLSNGAMAAEQDSGLVTFTKDVLPILQDNCQTCHRPNGLKMSGMVAPFSLMTYEETRPWAKSMAKATASGEMPPWHATDATRGVFENERGLTEDEIATLKKWAAQGSKKGDPADAPKPIEFPETGWSMGTPDLVLTFDEPFFVEDDVEDLYEDFTVQITDEQMPTDRWIKSIELRPDSHVVHHILAYAHAPGEGDGIGLSPDRGLIGGNAPGTDSSEYPEGFGILLKKNSYVTFAMHYHKEAGKGTGAYDRSEIGIKFHPKDALIPHPVQVTYIDHGNFEIPPGHPHWRVGGARVFGEDTLLLALMPHMHLRGSAARYIAYYPDGTSEELLDVPEYDFNWQTLYRYKEHKLLPRGTRLEMELWYDNSQERGDYAGINPERAIRFGGPTTDEMDLAWITVAPAHPQTSQKSGD